VRSPKKQTASGRDTEGGSRSLSAHAYDYTRSVPSASIYSGRTLLGYLVDGDRECTALTPERELIGLFPDRKSATIAILFERRSASTAV
jgi:hypothetical protein